MALEITEFNELAEDRRGNVVAAPKGPPIAEQQVTIGAGSLDSSAITGKFVRLHVTAAARLAFGVAPTASATSTFRMAADQTEFIEVIPGQIIAVING